MLAPLECASRTILQEQQCQVSKVDMENVSKGTLLFSAVCETKLLDLSPEVLVAHKWLQEKPHPIDNWSYFTLDVH